MRHPLLIAYTVPPDTKEQPFSCGFCPQKFSRSDVLHRHLQRIHPEARDDFQSPRSATKSRSAVACDRCHSKKLKCVGGVPCRSCATQGVSCLFERTRRRDKAVASPNVATPMTQGPEPSQLPGSSVRVSAGEDEHGTLPGTPGRPSLARDMEDLGPGTQPDPIELGMPWNDMLNTVTEYQNDLAVSKIYIVSHSNAYAT
jgi:hypothetical protein